MMKYLAFFFLTLVSNIHSFVELPTMIDFATFDPQYFRQHDPSNSWQKKLSNACHQTGFTAFDYSPEFAGLFAYIKDTFNINTVVETGAYTGDNTQFFANCFPQVYSIEDQKSPYLLAKETFKNKQNIHCCFGSSSLTLDKILSSLKKETVVVYLNGQQKKNWSLLEEIQAIGRTHKDNCIIVINGLKVPGRTDLEFDKCKIGENLYECSPELIKSELDKAFTGYSLFCFAPEHGHGRAKVVAIPKSLNQFSTFNPQFVHHNRTNWKWQQHHLGLSAFNDAPEFGAFFAHLINTYKISTAIETGTYVGDTTQFLANNFKQVHTIEFQETLLSQAKENLKNKSNIHFHLGNSGTVLAQILPSLKKEPVIFYLDAHWEKNWPLLNELREIGKTHRDNCIIVIDDFKVPDRNDLPYDSYMIGETLCECSYEFIKKEIDTIFTEYSIHYLAPKRSCCRAKFVAIPKSLKQRV